MINRLSNRGQTPHLSSSGLLRPVRPVSSAEERFVNTLAQQITYATAQVAANPRQRFANGSLEQRVRSAFLRTQFDDRQGMQQRAQMLLSKPAAEQRRYFGDVATATNSRNRFTPRSFNLPSRKSTPAFSPEMKTLLRQAVRERVNSQRGEIQHLAAWAAAKMFKETWVLVGEGLHKEMHLPAARRIYISKPRSLQFIWGTKVDKAEVGLWKLVGPQSELLASGYAGKAPDGMFSIDLRQYLPSQPPQAPAVSLYRVYVQPRTKTKTVPGTTMGSSKKVPSKAVGDWSAAAEIYYGIMAPQSAPPTVFDFDEVYRKNNFVFESIKMLEDQTGWGAEEFHVRGFVQEFSPQGTIQLNIGAYAELHPDGPTKATFNFKYGPFHLSNPGAPRWPRTYVAMLSVMEEDGGGDISDWQNEISDIALEMLSKEVQDAVREILEEEFGDLILEELEKVLDDYEDELLRQAIDASALIVDLITGIIANSGAAILVGMVVAVTVYAVWNVINELDDDFYAPLNQNSVFSLTLPTNDVDYIHDLDGQQHSDGTYRLKSLKKQYYGTPAANQAAAWDGKVELRVRWEFFQRETL